MSNFQRLCKIYKKEKKPKECKDIVRIQKELLKKAQEEIEKNRKAEEVKQKTEEALKVVRDMIRNEKIEKRRQRDKKNYIKNREKILERRRSYYVNNVKGNPEVLEARRKYRQDNKDRINENRRIRNEKSRKENVIIKYKCNKKKYYQENKEKIKLRVKKYYQENKDKAQLATKKWYYHNRRTYCAKARKIYLLKKFIKKLILKQYFYYLKNVCQ